MHFTALTATSTIVWLIIFAFFFALAGMLYARHRRDNLEDYVVARNSQGVRATTLTLLASSLGAWILFSPAQAATWGGVAAITGYALGSMAPQLSLLFLGPRMRQLVPKGHTLTEFVLHRYGPAMYRLALAIIIFYMFISLSAGITATAKMMMLIAPIPLGLTAAIVLLATLVYTSYGGLRATIFTDQLQMLVILPLLLLLVGFGIQQAGIGETVTRLRIQAPQLLAFDDLSGLKSGLTFFVAILLTGIFHQGNWQRIYAAQTPKALQRGFLLGGLLVAPFIFVMGLFGLAFVAYTPQGDPSVALFSFLLPHLPTWFVIALIPLALALVMSSADTTISAFSSLFIVDGQRLLPGLNQAALLRLSRWFVWLLCIPVWYVSAQGYSVLYLFLLADLLCSAAAFPVFYGLYSQRHIGRNAVLSTLAGLAVGLYLFPSPGGNMNTLLESFLAAAGVPAILSLLLERFVPAKQHFALESLKDRVQGMGQRVING